MTHQLEPLVRAPSPVAFPDVPAPSAHDVAAELRRRLPGLPTKKLHKLLYYCQGHHLATFSRPLFSESISAHHMGPVVAQLWYREKNREEPPPPTPLDEGQLNSMGYVVSRYGALTGKDLELLTHSEAPWRDATGGAGLGPACASTAAQSRATSPATARLARRTMTTLT